MKKTIKRILMVGLSCSLLMGCAACGQGNGTDKGLMWDRTFTEEEFASPDYEYRPMPILNQNISDYLIDMAEQYGYGGVVTNVSFGDQNYLQNEEAVELFVDAVEYAINDLGIRVWFMTKTVTARTCGRKSNEGKSRICGARPCGAHVRLSVGRAGGNRDPVRAYSFERNGV